MCRQKYSETLMRDSGTCYITARPEKKKKQRLVKQRKGSELWFPFPNNPSRLINTNVDGYLMWSTFFFFFTSPKASIFSILEKMKNPPTYFKSAHIGRGDGSNWYLSRLEVLILPFQVCFLNELVLKLFIMSKKTQEISSVSTQRQEEVTSGSYLIFVKYVYRWVRHDDIDHPAWMSVLACPAVATTQQEDAEEGGSILGLFFFFKLTLSRTEQLNGLWAWLQGSLRGFHCEDYQYQDRCLDFTVQ